MNRNVYFALTLCAAIATWSSSVTALDPLLQASRWRTFDHTNDLPSAYINDIAYTIQDEVWIATDHAIGMHTGTEFRESEIAGIHGHAHYYRLLIGIDGTLWVGTSVGVLRYIGREWEHVLATGPVSALTESADGAIWVAASANTAGRDGSGQAETGALIYRHRRGSWTAFGPSEGLPSVAARELFGDRDGSVWAIYGTGANRAELYRYLGGNWRDAASSMKPPTGPISCMSQTYDGAYWFGTPDRGIWRWRDDVWQTFPDSPVSGFAAATLSPMPDGTLWAAGSPAGTMWSYSRGRWLSHAVGDAGITGRRVSKMVYASDDAFWLAIPGRGLARFDRRGGPWWVYGRRSGLRPDASISAIGPVGDNSLWIGTSRGLLLYDGTEFAQVSPRLPGLTDHAIDALLVLPDGRIWIASRSDHVSPGIWELRNGNWRRVSTPHGLTDNATVTAMMSASNGDIWIGATDPNSDDAPGLLRLSGTRWSRYTDGDGLPSRRVLSIAEDAEGTIWAGTDDGIGRFSDGSWHAVPVGTHAGAQIASSILATSDGSIWVAGQTPEAGASRLKDGVWRHFSDSDGLASGDVWSIVEAEDGSVWFGTAHGVSRFDGERWMTVRAGGGIAKDEVWAAAAARDGSLWFGHFDGYITKYHAIDTAPPRVVTEPVPETIAYPGFIEVDWRARDRWDRTPPSDLMYSWRLDEGPWSAPASITSLVFEELPRGRHLLEVRAIDQELNEDGVGAWTVLSVAPPFWLTLWFLVPTATTILASATLGSLAYRRNRQYRRARARLVRELQRELHVAQELQAGLLPQSDPVVAGLDITGVCQPASQVGGDYFAYLWHDDDGRRIGIAIADVTGHAMEAAIPAVMLSGMLATAAQQTSSPGEILTTLNESLLSRIGKNTFICCTIAAFDLEERAVYLANAGGIDPIHRTGGVIAAVGVHGNRLPLGMAAGVDYVERRLSVEPGDVFVFFTDGIVEAMSPAGQMFGFDRVHAAIGVSGGVDEVRESVLSNVRQHLSGREPVDDITLIAVHAVAEWTPPT